MISIFSYLTNNNCRNIVSYYHSRVDSTTKEVYERMYTLMQTSESVMKLFVVRSFFDVYRIISTDVLRGGGLNTQTAATHLSLAFVDLFFGLPTDLGSLMGLSQVGYKKGSLGINETMQDDLERFVGVPDDSHVRNTFIWFVLNKEKLKPAQAVRMIQMFCRKISPRIGCWANDVCAQLGQFLDGDDKQCQFAIRVFQEMATKYMGKDDEGEYDDLIDDLIHPNFCRKVRNQPPKIKESDIPVAIRKEKRSCADYEKREPLQRRVQPVRIEESEDESSDEEVELSEYEMARAERIVRNVERLKSLGFYNGAY